MQDALDGLLGGRFEVTLTEVVVGGDVACALLQLPPMLPCANKLPHVTLGVKVGAGQAQAAWFLQAVEAGLREGVSRRKLDVPVPVSGIVALEYCTIDDARAMSVVEDKQAM
eukprot:41900-Amphidinium_carterae.1